METVAKPARGTKRLLITCVLFVVTLVFSMAVEEMPQLSNAVRIPVVLVPVIIFAWFIFQQRRHTVAAADELEQRIQLEALSIAYPLTFLLIVVLGQLERVVALNPEDWDYSHIWPFVFIFYLFGLMVARKRYQ
jgi:hypothetical protein